MFRSLGVGDGVSSAQNAYLAEISMQEFSDVEDIELLQKCKIPVRIEWGQIKSGASCFVCDVGRCMRYLKIIILLSVLAVTSVYGAETASWGVQDTTAAVTIYLKDATKPGTRALLLVNFPKNQNCRPEIAVLISNRYDIGKPISRERNLDSMYVTVGNRTITGAATYTGYEYGLDISMISRDDEVSIFYNGEYATVKYMKNWKPFVFPLKNALRAVNTARKNCYR